MEDKQVTLKYNKDILQWTSSTTIDGMEYISFGGSEIEAIENLKGSLDIEEL